MEINVTDTPVSGPGSTPSSMTDEEQRKLCFDLFNSYWEEAFNRGIPFDTIGTMSISAALFAIVAKHGVETTAEFVEDLVTSIREDKFAMTNTRN